MINVIEREKEYEVSFRYDPAIVFLVKNVPGRMYNPATKTWTVPKDRLGFLLNEFKGTPYEKYVDVISNEDIGVNQTLDSTIEIPDVDISDYTYYVKEGSKPYQHQLDSLKYAVARQDRGMMSGFILADDMGLGKSLQSTNIALYNKQHLGFKRCLIICGVNPAKYHWKEDIELHTNGEYIGYIIGTRYTKRKPIKENPTRSTESKLEDLKTCKMYGNKDGEDLPYFIITNIESLRAKQGKKYVISDAIIDMINRKELDMIIIDEVHKNMSPSSTQGKQLLRIKKYVTRPFMWIPMTGTPIVNKPTDVFLPLKLIDGHTYNGYWEWCKEFCIYGGFGGKEIVEYKNIPKLKLMLQNNMLRRLKDDVLDLPDKIICNEYVDNTLYQRKLYDEVAAGIIARKDEIQSSLNPLSQFIRLRQVNECPEVLDDNLEVDSKYLSKNAKLARLLEILEDIHERGEKVVIFSNWVQPLRTVWKLIHKKYGTCCFTGTMKESEREQHKKVFIENPNYTVILGTIGAMGTMHTFTVARNAIFIDCPWNMAEFNQACDRIHRIGTTQSVNIYKLITRNTIDERIENILYRKGGISNYIVDNIDIRSNPELFDLLLSDTLK